LGGQRIVCLNETTNAPQKMNQLFPASACQNATNPERQPFEQTVSGAIQLFQYPVMVNLMEPEFS